MALPKPPKKYYTLEEVAQDWDWTVAELWDYAEQQKLEVCILLKSRRAHIVDFELDIYTDNVIDKIPTFDMLLPTGGLHPIHPIQLDQFHPIRNEFGMAIDYLIIKDPQPTDASEKISPHNPEAYTLKGYEFFETVYNPPLVITNEEKTRFEEEHGHEPPAKKPPYLNPDHPCFSTELCDAVTAWLRTVKQNPEPQKFKAIAKEWLENASYEGQALDRLATVVNPDKGKKGGAPKKE